MTDHERRGMAIIHKTTLTPSKLELLAEWLPVQRRLGVPRSGEAAARPSPELSA